MTVLHVMLLCGGVVMRDTVWWMTDVDELVVPGPIRVRPGGSQHKAWRGMEPRYQTDYGGANVVAKGAHEDLELVICAVNTWLHKYTQNTEQRLRH